MGKIDIDIAFLTKIVMEAMKYFGVNQKFHLVIADKAATRIFYWPPAVNKLSSEPEDELVEVRKINLDKVSHMWENPKKLWPDKTGVLHFVATAGDYVCAFGGKDQDSVMDEAIAATILLLLPELELTPAAKNELAETMLCMENEKFLDLFANFIDSEDRRN